MKNSTDQLIWDDVLDDAERLQARLRHRGVKSTDVEAITLVLQRKSTMYQLDISATLNDLLDETKTNQVGLTC